MRLRLSLRDALVRWAGLLVVARRVAPACCPPGRCRQRAPRGPTASSKRATLRSRLESNASVRLCSSSVRCNRCAGSLRALAKLHLRAFRVALPPAASRRTRAICRGAARTRRAGSGSGAPRAACRRRAQASLAGVPERRPVGRARSPPRRTRRGAALTAALRKPRKRRRRGKMGSVFGEIVEETPRLRRVLNRLGAGGAVVEVRPYGEPSRCAPTAGSRA